MNIEALKYRWCLAYNIFLVLYQQPAQTTLSWGGNRFHLHGNNLLDIRKIWAGLHPKLFLTEIFRRQILLKTKCLNINHKTPVLVCREISFHFHSWVKIEVVFFPSKYHARFTCKTKIIYNIDCNLPCNLPCPSNSAKTHRQLQGGATPVGVARGRPGSVWQSESAKENEK